MDLVSGFSFMITYSRQTWSVIFTKVCLSCKVECVFPKVVVSILHSNVCVWPRPTFAVYLGNIPTSSISRLFPFKANDNRFAIFSIIFSAINGRYRFIELHWMTPTPTFRIQFPFDQEFISSHCIKWSFIIVLWPTSIPDYSWMTILF